MRQTLRIPLPFHRWWTKVPQRPSKFPMVKELVKGRAKFLTEAVWFCQPFELQLQTLMHDAHSLHWYNPESFLIANAMLQFSSCLNVPCSHKPPCLYSSCSLSLEGSSPALALTSPHSHLPHPNVNTCSFFKPQFNTHLLKDANLYRGRNVHSFLCDSKETYTNLFPNTLW